MMSIDFSLGSSMKVNETVEDIPLGFESHEPFYIQGNAMMLEYAETGDWPGTGASDNPIIIEGYYFECKVHVFTVSGTTLHFIFRNNILDGIDEQWCVIVFSNVANAVVDKNIIINGAVGAHIMMTNHTVISNNNIYGQSWDAVYMETDCYYNVIEDNYFHDLYEAGVWSWNGCSDNIVRNNVIHNVLYGVSFQDNTPRNSIINNSIFNTTVAGIYTSCNETTISLNKIHDIKADGINIKSRLNTVDRNWIYHTGGYGIHMFDTSGENHINNNTFIKNECGAIRLRDSDHNNILSNNFFENGMPQIYDTGLENNYCYNYWHEEQGDDLNNDGYYDTIYSIPGLAGSEDPSPKTQPSAPMPSWYDFQNVSYPMRSITPTTSTYTTHNGITSTTSTAPDTSIQESTTMTTHSTLSSIPESSDILVPIITASVVVLVLIGGVLLAKKLIGK